VRSTRARPVDALVAATLAGADAIVATSEPVPALLSTLRLVAASGSQLPPIPPRVQASAAAALQPADRAILAMRLAGTSNRDIAATVGLHPSALERREATILATLDQATSERSMIRATSVREAAPSF
jgi:DNA-binding NarL/FixJ family response regulator